MRPPTDFTLTDQLRITDREIRRRQELLHFGNDDAQTLIELKALIAPLVDPLVEEFYAGQVAEPEIARLIGDAVTLSRLKKHMRLYILALFDGDYGHDYVLSRLRIGLVHKRIGVSPKLYVAAISNLLNRLRQLILRQTDNQCGRCTIQVAALEKILLFDLELVFDTYIHSLMDELARGKEEIERYAEGLEETVAQRTRELAELASKDGLTGLLNQRNFYEELRRELARNQRQIDVVTLIYFDLDGFKAVNDTLGHHRGDEILLQVAEVIRRVVREEDLAARYGGDEFCIILPHTPAEMGRQVAERLISSFDAALAESGVTLSIGIAAVTADSLQDADTLVKRADSAMYQSKKKAGHAITMAEA
ncbi:MAG: GGDEF domain-containing protein [Desulfobulbaceae bacterium]|nr:GGDEF domain-containing protein [Desulfobulbaceae bacterium]